MNPDLSYDLHLIASEPDTNGPDATARLLGSYTTRAEAHAAGRRYVQEHPGAWLQVQDSEQRQAGEDVDEADQ